jgi:hypothetical protein
MRGARRDMGLGPYPAVSLSEARIAAGDPASSLPRALIRLEPGDPRARQKPVPTFGEVAQLVIADAKRKSANAKVHYQWERHLGPVYCGPLLMRPVHEITTLDVAAVLRPVWHDKPEVARKLYPAIRRVFEHARVRLRDDHRFAMPDNPARWVGFQQARRQPSMPRLRLNCPEAVTRRWRISKCRPSWRRFGKGTQSPLGCWNS